MQRLFRPIIRNKFRLTKEERKSFWNITRLTNLNYSKSKGRK